MSGTSKKKTLKLKWKTIQYPFGYVARVKCNSILVSILVNINVLTKLHIYIRHTPLKMFVNKRLTACIMV